jgi:hypothetical protein
LIGGVAGAMIGDANHHKALEGAAIGAAAGYVWNTLTQPAVSTPAYAPPVPQAGCPAPAPTSTVVVTAPPRVVYVDRPVYVERPVVIERPVYVRPERRVIYVVPARRW